MAMVIPFALAIILIGCRPQTAPPPDFTTLKRDLLELDQSLGLSRRSGVVHPDRYIAALEQLERDYRLAREKPTGVAQQGLEAVLQNARLLRQAAAQYTARASAIGYDPDELPKDKLAGQWWALLEKLFLNFHPGPSEDAIDLAVQALEAAEHPAATK